MTISGRSLLLYMLCAVIVCVPLDIQSKVVWEERCGALVSTGDARVIIESLDGECRVVLRFEGAGHYCSCGVCVNVGPGEELLGIMSDPPVTIPDVASPDPVERSLDVLAGSTSPDGVPMSATFTPDPDAAFFDALEWGSRLWAPRIGLAGETSEIREIGESQFVVDTNPETRLQISIAYGTAAMQASSERLKTSFQVAGFEDDIAEGTFDADLLTAAVHWIPVSVLSAQSDLGSVDLRQLQGVTMTPLLLPPAMRRTEGVAVCPLYSLSWEVPLAPPGPGEYLVVVTVEDFHDLEPLRQEVLAAAQGDQGPQANPIVWNPEDGHGLPGSTVKHVASALRLRVLEISALAMDESPIDIFVNEETDDGDPLPDSWEKQAFASPDFTTGCLDWNENSQLELFDFLTGTSADREDEVRIVVTPDTLKEVTDNPGVVLTEKEPDQAWGDGRNSSQPKIWFDYNFPPDKWFPRNEARKLRIGKALNRTIDGRLVPSFISQIKENGEIIYSATDDDFFHDLPEWIEKADTEDPSQYFFYDFVPTQSVCFEVEWSLADLDSDHMPVEWELEHGLDPDRNDDFLDLDGDGLTNLQEYLLGTDPNSKYWGRPIDRTELAGTDGPGVEEEEEEEEDPPVITSLKVDDDGSVVIRWEPGDPRVFGYMIERSEFNDSETAIWETLKVLADPVELVFTDAEAGFPIPTFYRIIAVDAFEQQIISDPVRLDWNDSLNPSVKPWSPGWALAHFGNLNQLPGDDFDGDGATNEEEFFAGTDPREEDTDLDGILDGDEWGREQLPWSYLWRTGNPVAVNESATSALVPDGVEDQIWFVDGNDVGVLGSVLDVVGDTAWKWESPLLPSAIVSSPVPVLGSSWHTHEVTLPDDPDEEQTVTSEGEPTAHYFALAENNKTLLLKEEDVLVAYVYLDPADPTQGINLQLFTTRTDDEGNVGIGELDDEWDFSVTWGDLAPRWKEGEGVYLGPLPKQGVWRRLEVPLHRLLSSPDAPGGADDIGDFAADNELRAHGIAFQNYEGTVLWGYVGVTSDTDSDRMPDEWERRHGLVVGQSDGNGDADGDLLVNRLEYRWSTDPNSADTDDDTFADAAEITLYSSDPLDFREPADDIAQCADLPSLTPQQTTLLADSLFAYYEMTEGGGELLRDHTLAQNHGVLIDGVRWGYGPNNEGVIEFGGGPEHVRVDNGNAASMEVSDDMAISFAFRGSDDGDTAEDIDRVLITSKTGLGESGGFAVTYNSFRQNLTFHGEGEEKLTAKGLILPQGWHHVFISKKRAENGGVPILYIDGREVAPLTDATSGALIDLEKWPTRELVLTNEGFVVSALSAIQPASTDLLIGGDGTVSFIGKLDRLKIYSAFIEEELVAILYGAESCMRREQKDCIRYSIWGWWNSYDTVYFTPTSPTGMYWLDRAFRQPFWGERLSSEGDLYSQYSLPPAMIDDPDVQDKEVMKFSPGHALYSAKAPVDKPPLFVMHGSPAARDADVTHTRSGGGMDDLINNFTITMAFKSPSKLTTILDSDDFGQPDGVAGLVVHADVNDIVLESKKLGVSKFIGRYPDVLSSGYNLLTIAVDGQETVEGESPLPELERRDQGHRIYVNGIMVGSSSSRDYSIGVPNKISAELTPSAVADNAVQSDADWYLSEIVIYDGALTEAERVHEERYITLNDQDLQSTESMDGDQMPDVWEYGVFGHRRFGDDQDQDGDGVSNLEEYESGAHPLLSDTDGDGVDDYEEIVAGTSSTAFDTDGDGLPDGWELDNQLDPHNPNDAHTDADEDKVEAFLEYLAGSSAIESDSDFDTIPDLWEIQRGMHPGIDDASRAVPGLKGTTYLELYQNGGLDTDSDGIPDFVELALNSNPSSATANQDTDVMPDAWEIFHGLDPLVDDGDSDEDGDLLSAALEFQRKTSPLYGDSDSDGMDDGWEHYFLFEPSMHIPNLAEDDSLIGFWSFNAAPEEDEDEIEAIIALLEKRGGDYGEIEFPVLSASGYMAATTAEEEVKVTAGYETSALFIGTDTISLTDASGWNVRSDRNFSLAFWMVPEGEVTIPLAEDGTLLPEEVTLGPGEVVSQKGYFRLYIDHERPRLNLQAHGGETIFTEVAAVPNVWQHVVLRQDVSQGLIEMWINGELADSVAVPSSPVLDGWPIMLGLPDSMESRGAKVALDHVMIYDRLLTANEIVLLADWRDGAYERNQDADGDGLRNLGEYENKSLPRDKAELLEQFTVGTPEYNNLQDSIARLVSSADTDGDGLDDNAEHPSNAPLIRPDRVLDPLTGEPLDPRPAVSLAYSKDSDGDGLDDFAELNFGVENGDPRKGASMPMEGDSDGDGLGDYVEAYWYGPKYGIVRDQVRGLFDSWALAFGSGYDLDGDGSPDIGGASDFDEDGYSNSLEIEAELNPFLFEPMKDAFIDNDADNDGLSNFAENHIYLTPSNQQDLEYVLHRLVGGNDIRTVGDLDGDGRLNADELIDETNPLDPSNRSAMASQGILMQQIEIYAEKFPLLSTINHQQGAEGAWILLDDRGRTVQLNYTKGEMIVLRPIYGIDLAYDRPQVPILVEFSDELGNSGEVVLIPRGDTMIAVPGGGASGGRHPKTLLYDGPPPFTDDLAPPGELLTGGSDDDEEEPKPEGPFMLSSMPFEPFLLRNLESGKVTLKIVPLFVPTIEPLAAPNTISPNEISVEEGTEDGSGNPDCECPPEEDEGEDGEEDDDVELVLLPRRPIFEFLLNPSPTIVREPEQWFISSGDGSEESEEGISTEDPTIAMPPLAIGVDEKGAFIHEHFRPRKWLEDLGLGGLKGLFSEESGNQPFWPYSRNSLWADPVEGASISLRFDQALNTLTDTKNLVLRLPDSYRIENASNQSGSPVGGVVYDLPNGIETFSEGGIDGEFVRIDTDASIGGDIWIRGPLQAIRLVSLGGSDSEEGEEPENPIENADIPFEALSGFELRIYDIDSNTPLPEGDEEVDSLVPIGRVVVAGGSSAEGVYTDPLDIVDAGDFVGREIHQFYRLYIRRELGAEPTQEEYRFVSNSPNSASWTRLGTTGEGAVRFDLYPEGYIRKLSGVNADGSATEETTVTFQDFPWGRDVVGIQGGPLLGSGGSIAVRHETNPASPNFSRPISVGYQLGADSSPSLTPAQNSGGFDLSYADGLEAVASPNNGNSAIPPQVDEGYPGPENPGYGINPYVDPNAGPGTDEAWDFTDGSFQDPRPFVSKGRHWDSASDVNLTADKAKLGWKPSRHDPLFTWRYEIVNLGDVVRYDLENLHASDEFQPAVPAARGNYSTSSVPHEQLLGSRGESIIYYRKPGENRYTAFLVIRGEAIELIGDAHQLTEYGRLMIKRRGSESRSLYDIRHEPTLNWLRETGGDGLQSNPPNRSIIRSIKPYRLRTYHLGHYWAGNATPGEPWRLAEDYRLENFRLDDSGLATASPRLEFYYLPPAFEVNDYLGIGLPLPLVNRNEFQWSGSLVLPEMRWKPSDGGLPFLEDDKLAYGAVEPQHSRDLWLWSAEDPNSIEPEAGIYDRTLRAAPADTFQYASAHHRNWAGTRFTQAVSRNDNGAQGWNKYPVMYMVTDLVNGVNEDIDPQETSQPDNINDRWLFWPEDLRDPMTVHRGHTAVAYAEPDSSFTIGLPAGEQAANLYLSLINIADKEAGRPSNQGTALSVLPRISTAVGGEVKDVNVYDMAVGKRKRPRNDLTVQQVNELDGIFAQIEALSNQYEAAQDDASRRQLAGAIDSKNLEAKPYLVDEAMLWKAVLKEKDDTNEERFANSNPNVALAPTSGEKDRWFWTGMPLDGLLGLPGISADIQTENEDSIVSIVEAVALTERYELTDAEIAALPTDERIDYEANSGNAEFWRERPPLIYAFAETGKPLSDGTDRFARIPVLLRPVRTPVLQEQTGADYRVTGLDGIPTSQPGESSIDALTLNLNHGTSDISVGLGASSLGLSVRRQAVAETWSPGGMVVSDRPDRPFGPCWASNLTSYIQFSGRDYVVNTPGGVYVYRPYTDGNGDLAFRLAPGGKREATSYLNKFSKVTEPFANGVAGYLLELNSGVKFYFEERGRIAYQYKEENDKAIAPLYQIPYARLLAVEDAAENKLLCRYRDEGAPQNLIDPRKGYLIPTRIEDPNRLDNGGGTIGLDITLSPDGKRIETVTDPRGKTTTYHYTADRELNRVEFPANGGGNISYSYNYAKEASLKGEASTEIYHANLASIKRGNSMTSFEYKFDHSKQLWRDNWNSPLVGADSAGALLSSGRGRFEVQRGLPRWVSMVTLPDETKIKFFNDKKLLVGWNGDQQNPKRVVISSESSTGVVQDYRGVKHTYTFNLAAGDDSIFVGTDSFIDRIAVSYSSFDIEHEGLGTETFSFDVGAAFALSSMSDLNDRTTSISYDLSASAHPEITAQINSQALDATYLYPRFALPTKREMQGEGPVASLVESFPEADYDLRWLRPTKTVDPEGRITKQTFDGQTGLLTKEQVLDPAVPNNPTLVYEVDYAYGHAAFGAFVTKQTTKDLDGNGGGDLVVNLVPDTAGRVKKRSIGPSGQELVEIEMNYDPNGNLSWSKDEYGSVTNFQYDDMNRVTETDLPEDIFGVRHSRTASVDPDARISTSQDENGVETETIQDALGRPVMVTVKQAHIADPEAPNAKEDVVTRYRYPDPLTVEITLPVDTDTERKKLITSDSYGRIVELIDGLGDSDDEVKVTHSYELMQGGGSVFGEFQPDSTTSPGLISSTEYDHFYRAEKVTEEYDDGSGVMLSRVAHVAVYDGVGNVLEVTNAAGKTTTSEYDALNRVVERHHPGMDANGAGTGTEYFAYATTNGQLWRQEDIRGNVTTTKFDIAGRVSETTEPARGPPGGNVSPTVSTTVTYNQGPPPGEPLPIDPNQKGSHWIEYTNDLANQDGSQRVYIDKRGRTWKTQGPKTAVDGDLLHPVQRPTTTVAHDAVGNVLAVVPPRMHSGDGTCAIDGGTIPGPTTALTRLYDGMGSVMRTTDLAAMMDDGVVRSTFVDHIRRIDGAVTQKKTRGMAPQPGGLWAATGESIEISYPDIDLFGRVKEVVNPGNHSEKFTYDLQGNLSTAKDARNWITEFKYDGLGRQLRRIYPNGASGISVDVVSEYGPAYLASIDHGANQRTEYQTYDDAGRPTVTSLRSYTYQHDALKRVAESASQRVVATDYGLDGFGQLTGETTEHVDFDTTFGFEYDELGNGRKTTYPGTNREVIAERENFGRLEQIRDGANNVTEIGIEIGGEVVRRSLPDGSEIVDEIDARGRVQYREFTTPNGNRTVRIDYGYDDLDRVRSTTEKVTEGATIVRFRQLGMEYRSDGRLGREATFDASGNGTELRSLLHDYDPSGNRISTIESLNGVVTTTSTFDLKGTENGLNQLHSIIRQVPGGSSETISFIYDEAGNREERWHDGALTHKYLWDVEGRLDQVTVYTAGTPVVHSYHYDYLGRRVEELIDGSSLRQAWLGPANVQEYAGTNATPEAENIRGPGGRGSVGTLLYTDRGGVETTAFNNSRGDIVARHQGNNESYSATYDGFGEVVDSTGINEDRLGQNSKLESAGLVYFGKRYYDPEAGVWISRDPAGYVDGLNLYAYVKGDPWSQYDPDGRFSVLAIGFAIGFTLDVGFQLSDHISEGGDWKEFFTKAGWTSSKGGWSIGKSLAMGAIGSVTGGIGGRIAGALGGLAIRRGLSQGVGRAIGAYSGNAIAGGLDGGISRVATNVMDGDPATHWRDGVGRDTVTGVIYGIGFTKILRKFGRPRVSRTASQADAPKGGGSLWQSRFPGVQVRQIGNHWVKRVNPNSNRFVQAWGQRTINQQAGALSRLQAAGRPAAGSRLTSSGRLIVEDVGTPLSRWNYLNPAYWGARRADARAMGGAGRFFNDLRPGNYGAGFRAFDPALDPGVGALGIGGGTAIGGGVLWWTLSGDE